MNLTDWYGAYDGGWGDWLVPEAYSHPAKMARGLLDRIIKTGFERGYWTAGSLIGDPFGGIGSTGIIGASYGLRVVCVELEERFVELAKQNFAKHRNMWEKMGDPLPVIVQGDSRRFAEIVGEVAGVVSSPPFLGAHGGVACSGEETGGIEAQRAKGEGARAGRIAEHYGTTTGQIGALKSGSVEGVISSPPFVQTGTLDHDGQTTKLTKTFSGGGTKFLEASYGTTEGNIGNLKAGKLETCDGIVSSPPWEDQLNNHDKKWCPPKATPGVYQADYGDSAGQIGRDSGENYWSAMKQVYTSMHAAMKPGAVAALVVKDYVAKGKRVPLCDDTCRLLESLGFEVFERTRAWLVKTSSHPGLFGEDVTRTKSRKSFFRRLAESKGSPEINWEEVLWARR